MSRESKSAVTIRRRRRCHWRDVWIRAKGLVDEELMAEDPEERVQTPGYGPIYYQRLFITQGSLLSALLAFRILNCLCNQTSYVPDEYWQSLEVSHRMTFGYGYETWEWKKGLRSYLYPSIFAMIYKLLYFIKADSRTMMVRIPMIFQGCVSAFGDLYLYKFSCKLTDSRVAHWALICQLTSWFHFYCATRTLTNTMETALTSIALYYYPWPAVRQKAHWKFILIISLSTILRPTSMILWIPLCLWHLFRFRRSWGGIVKLYVEICFLVLSLSSILDRYFYGRWINVTWNFLEFNVFSGLGAFYGSHPFHWYLSQGFPVILASHLPIYVIALKKRVFPVLLRLVAWVVFVYSFLSHKEFRFIYPVLPMAMFVCGKQINNWVTSSSQQKGKQRTTMVLLYLLLTNIPIALYTGLLHQRGTIDVMRYLHHQSNELNGKMKVWFLMPCHSTPYYSHIHANISMKFLTCHPNLDHAKTYKDEAAVFFENPEKWLGQNYPGPVHPQPTHLVIFSILQQRLVRWLTRHSFKVTASYFHTHFPQGEIGNHVIVLTSKNYRPADWNR